jgi:nucleoside 2-deoxyribosyltransferase
LTVSERVARGLLKIVSEVPRVDHKFNFGDSEAHEGNEFLAETECEDRREGVGLLRIMEKMGLLSSDDKTPLCFELTPQGWSRYEELTSQGADSIQGFVAMWFGDEVTSAYTDGIKPAIEDAGYRALRIDDREHIDKIDDQIIAEIRRSRFVVADFSCPPNNVRGGVYYEAGFAHGLRIPVFYTCRQSSFHDVHFDTRQYAHILWTDHADLRAQLRNRIRAVLGDGPLRNKSSKEGQVVQ